MPFERAPAVQGLSWGAVAAAFMLGLGGSMHCLMMCGPLACAALGGDPQKKVRSALAYHLARVVAYGVVGLALGAVGGGFAKALSVNLAPAVPWLLAASLLAAAFDFGKRVQALPGLGRVAAMIARWGAGMAAPVRAGAIGAATPLLPCGFLYGVYLTAAATGSAAGGGVILGVFALAAVPALVVAQVGTAALLRERRWTAFALQRVLPVAVALILVVRAVVKLTMAGGPHAH